MAVRSGAGHEAIGGIPVFSVLLLDTRHVLGVFCVCGQDEDRISG